MVISYLYVLILAWIFINDSAPSLFFSKVCIPNKTKNVQSIAHLAGAASVFVRHKFLHPDLDIMDSGGWEVQSAGPVQAEADNNRNPDKSLIAHCKS